MEDPTAAYLLTALLVDKVCYFGIRGLRLVLAPFPDFTELLLFCTSVEADLSIEDSSLQYLGTTIKD